MYAIPTGREKSPPAARIGQHSTKGEVLVGFHRAYENLLATNRKGSSAERLRRLQSGLGFAELTFLKNVWWPLIGNFEFLHPEYEVPDYSEKSRFIDFACLRPGIKLAIEIDGFSSHVKNVDRWQFAYRLHRQNVLTVDGWDILRFPFDDVANRPRQCQRTIQQYMGLRFATESPGKNESPRVTAIDREIVRLARTLSGTLSPGDVARHLGTSRHTVYRHLQRLVERGWLQPASGTKRIRTYALTEAMHEFGM